MGARDGSERAHPTRSATAGVPEASPRASWKRFQFASAWSWGISRLIDGLEQVKDQMGIDTGKMCCSLLLSSPSSS